MNRAAEAEFTRVTVNAPAREGTRSFFHVLLGVMALAEGEQLHHFACKILVRCTFAVLRAVKIDQHRRVFADVA